MLSSKLHAVWGVCRLVHWTKGEVERDASRRWAWGRLGVLMTSAWRWVERRVPWAVTLGHLVDVGAARWQRRLDGGMLEQGVHVVTSSFWGERRLVPLLSTRG